MTTGQKGPTDQRGQTGQRDQNAAAETGRRRQTRGETEETETRWTPRISGSKVSRYYIDSV